LARAHPKWHYEGRVKSEESYALKVESGRFGADGDIDDFFGCWLVVENLSQLADAEALVRREFRVRGRRPSRDDRTHKRPEAFPFDGLRLKAFLRPDPTRRVPLHSYRFEVQVKTFLEHAWTVATHDLTYKGGAIGWPLSRIAYQVKAMLEHAEVTIERAPSLTAAAGIAKSDAHTSRLEQVADLLRTRWTGRLPGDEVTLASTVAAFLEHAGMSVDELASVLETETEASRGSDVQNLSPYAAIVQSVLHQRPHALGPRGSARFNVIVPREVDIPPSCPSIVVSQLHIVGG
jgi:ppGpp synthetase/RelA/SpoT-type nucleotidyltranferase